MGALLTLVRHGETPANIEGVWHGSTDSPLTERGEAQAQRVASFLAERAADAVALYSSPLQRAHRTARAIGGALSLEPRIESGLAEYDLGSWEGKTYEVLMKEHELWHHMKHDLDFRPHGGESPRQVSDRFTGALHRIHEEHAGERVIVVAHGGALSIALGALLDNDPSQWRRVMKNCAVTELRLDPEPQLVTFNLTDHLEGLLG